MSIYEDIKKLKDSFISDEVSMKTIDALVNSEKDAIKEYEMALSEENLSADVKDMLTEILEDEKDHLKMLQNYKDNGTAEILDSFINDMALSRADAMDRCISLGKQFINHFDKIYKDSKNEAVNHWVGEMKGWLNSVKEIKLKSTNKPILSGELRDWFFTAGANPEDFMSDPTNEELESYDKFVNKLLSGSNIDEAIIKDSTIKDSEYEIGYIPKHDDRTYIRYIKAESEEEAINKLKSNKNVYKVVFINKIGD